LPFYSEYSIISLAVIWVGFIWFSGVFRSKDAKYTENLLHT